MTQRYRIAIHEAGHTVAHVALGYPLHDIAARLTNDGGESRSLFDPEEEENFSDTATSLVAGMIAERLICGDMSDFGHYTGDLNAVSDICCRVSASEAKRKAFFDACIQKAKNILKKNKAALVAIADVLIDKGFISSGQVIGIIIDSG